MADGERIENFLEKERAQKKRERYMRNQNKMRERNMKISPKVDREAILQELMGLSEHEISVRLMESREKTDQAIERLLLAEKHYSASGDQEKLQGLRREVSNAKKMEQCLEGFSENGKQIAKIYSMEQKAISVKSKKLKNEKQEITKNNKLLTDINSKISESEREIKELRQNERKMNTELEQLIRKTESFGQGKEEITQEKADQQIEDLKRISDLSNQKEDIAKILQEKQNDQEYLQALSEKKNLQEKIKASREKVKAYTAGESQEDKLINRCKFARQMLLAGKSWDEISIASIEKISDQEKENTQHEKSNLGSEKIEQSAEEQASRRPVQRSTAPETPAQPEQVKPEPEKEKEQRQEPEKEKPNTLPAVPAKSHPILSKIPFVGKFASRVVDGIMSRIRKIQDNYQEPEEYIPEEVEKPQEQTNTPRTPDQEVPRPTETSRHIPEEHSAETTRNVPEENSIKDKRDLFIEYLREAVEGEHTEQYKYSTNEGLEKQEMRPRVSERTQKEGEGKTQNENENVK